MEKYISVKPIQVIYECDACQKGKMKGTGEAFMTAPPKYNHVCDNCGENKLFGGINYPYIKYEFAE